MNRIISHYEILDTLGEGGMGIVYRARDLALDRLVAIKMLPAEKIGSAKMRERFIREARIASALNHPNVVTIYEVQNLDDSHLIAMEYVKGKSLADLIPGKGLPLIEAFEYAAQIAEGVAKAHALGIVHRDLKPANVMVTDEGLVKILDFGLAKRFDSVDADTVSHTMTAAFSEPGLIVGTVPYMSPEQAAGEQADNRSDVFSFGVMLYEMLAGARPFVGKTLIAVLQKIAAEQPPRLKSARPDLPDAVDEIVMKALAKKPDDRFQTMDELLVRLRATLAELHPRSKRERRFGWKAVVMVVVVAAFGAIIGIPSIRSRWLGQPDTSSTSVKLVDPAEPPASSLNAFEWTKQGVAYLARYDQQQSLDRSLEAFKKSVERDPNFAPGHAGLAEAYFRKNLLTPDPQWLRLANESSRKALELDSDLAAAHIARAIALIPTPQVEEAGGELRRALELDPHSAAAFIWQSEYFSVKGDVQRAEDSAREAVRLAPGDWNAHMALGRYLYKSGKYQPAITEWEEARRLSSDNILVLRNLSAAYHMVNRDEDAATTLQRALEVQPSPGLYNNLATLRFFQGRYVDSAAAFEKAVELNSTVYLYWGNLGDAHRWIPGHEQKAKDAYRQAIQLADEKLKGTPDNEEALANVAVYAAKSGDKSRALYELGRIKKTQVKFPVTFFKTAIVYEITGDRQSALRDLEECLRRGYSRTEVQNEPELTSLRTDRRYRETFSKLSPQ